MIMIFKRFYWSNYYVSETGVVKNNKELILIPQKKNTFLFHELSINGKTKRFGLARMVLLCHKPNIDYINLRAKHIDGDPFNNHIDNLTWI